MKVQIKTIHDEDGKTDRIFTADLEKYAEVNRLSAQALTIILMGMTFSTPSSFGSHNEIKQVEGV